MLIGIYVLYYLFVYVIRFILATSHKVPSFEGNTETKDCFVSEVHSTASKTSSKDIALRRQKC